MSLPPLSTLQILVLNTIGSSETSGPVLRDKLSQEGFRKSAPSFYQVMDRLKHAGFVESRYATEEVGGYKVRVKYFQMTGAGARALGDAQRFFGGLLWEGAICG